MNDLETRYLSAGTSDLRVEYRADDTRPRIGGYAAVYDSLSEDLGGFRERVQSGAFTRALREGADVRALIDHDPSAVLGRTRSGTLQLKSTVKGLLVNVDLPDTTRAHDLVESIRRGDVDGMSFGFRVRQHEWHVIDDVEVRDLLDVDLFDVSVVTFPAYPQTEVALRSLSSWRAGRWQPGLDLRRRRLRMMHY